VTVYKPGSFFVVSLNGPGGFLIGLGQALAGIPSRYEHAGMIIDADGTTVEARANGAAVGSVGQYSSQGLLISDAPIRLAGDTPDLRARVVAEARKLIDTPYSPLDYVAIGLLHLRLPSGWVRKRVQASGHMICSQLVDATFERAGIHLFDDGRLPGDVSPADLAAWAEDHS
jgi:hypothetical protein